MSTSFFDFNDQGTMVCGAALLLAIFYVLNAIEPTAGALCTIQGAGITFAIWAVLLWVLTIVLNLYLIVVRSQSLEKYERLCSVMCWFLPLVLAVLPLADDAYGPAGAWCWLKNRWGLALRTLVHLEQSLCGRHVYHHHLHRLLPAQTPGNTRRPGRPHHTGENPISARRRSTTPGISGDLLLPPPVSHHQPNTELYCGRRGTGTVRIWVTAVADDNDALVWSSDCGCVCVGQTDTQYADSN